MAATPAPASTYSSVSVRTPTTYQVLSLDAVRLKDQAIVASQSLDLLVVHVPTLVAGVVVGRTKTRPWMMLGPRPHRRRLAGAELGREGKRIGQLVFAAQPAGP
jgi:hypothetical protein